MKEFIKQLIEQHLKVLESLLKQYKGMGGDVTVFGPPIGTSCPDGEILDPKTGKCIPKNDPVG